MKDRPSEIIISAISTVRHVSLEVIVFCVLWPPIKNIEPFRGVILLLLSDDVIHIVMKDDVSDVALRFD